MAKTSRSRGAMGAAYHDLLVAGARRLAPDKAPEPDALAVRVDQ